MNALQSAVRRHAALFQHAIIPAGATGLLHATCHIGLCEAFVELPAGLASLAHLDDGVAEGEHVAHGDIVFQQAGGGEVFAESAGGAEHIAGADFRDPAGIVIERVVMQRLFGPTMMSRIPLGISS